MSSLKEYATFKMKRDTAANWALNNRKPLQGEWCLETDTGNVKIGDGLRAWNDLGYRQRLAIPYTLTSNKTHTLPPITGAPQTESVYWTGGGTYKLTIEKDDGTPLDYEGEGKGHIELESDGSNWQVREYEDDMPWVAPTLLNGWVTWVTSPFRYKVDKTNKRVMFIGGLDGSSATDDNVYNIPSNIIPKQRQDFPAITISSGVATLAGYSIIEDTMVSMPSGLSDLLIINNIEYSYV